MARTMERPKPTCSHLEQQLLWAPGCRRSRASPGPGREGRRCRRRLRAGRQAGTTGRYPPLFACTRVLVPPPAKRPRVSHPRGGSVESPASHLQRAFSLSLQTAMPWGVRSVSLTPHALHHQGSPEDRLSPAALPPCPGLPGAPAARCPPARHRAPPPAPRCPSVTGDVPCPCRAAAPRASPPTGREPWASSSQRHEAPVLSDVTSGYAGPGHPGETLPQAPRSSSRQ